LAASRLSREIVTRHSLFVRLNWLT
jgi:hypothetical protein